jgi:hypothetical protein
MVLCVPFWRGFARGGVSTSGRGNLDADAFSALGPGLKEQKPNGFPIPGGLMMGFIGPLDCRTWGRPGCDIFLSVFGLVFCNLNHNLFSCVLDWTKIFLMK